MRALEVGCGTGLFTEIFAQSGAAITALDLSPELIELARRREGLGNEVEFVCSSVEAYSPESRFDVVLGSSVLHHLELPSALECIRVFLKRRGSMAFAEPNGLNPQIFVQKRVDWLKRKMGDVPTEISFTRWSIEQLLVRCGFRDTLVTPRDWLHPATPDSLIPPLLRLQELLERVPLVREFAGSLYLFARKGSHLAE